MGSDESRQISDARRPGIDASTFERLMIELDDVDGDLRNDLIATYLADGPGLVESLVEAAAAGDATTVVAIAHTLRSTSALLGAVALADLLKQVEQVTRSSPASASPLAASVEDEYALVATSLDRLRWPSPARPVPTGSTGSRNGASS